MKKNPWKVKSIQEFTCLNCPECDFNSKKETIFQDHAIEKHPLSFVLFGKIRSVNLSSILFKVISTTVILRNTLLEMADKAGKSLALFAKYLSTKPSQ